MSPRWTAFAVVDGQDDSITAGCISASMESAERLLKWKTHRFNIFGRWKQVAALQGRYRIAKVEIREVPG